MKKRIVSSIMCLAMLLSLLPVSAFAAEGDGIAAKVTADPDTVTAAVSGDATNGYTVTLGGELAAPATGTTSDVTLTFSVTKDGTTSDAEVTATLTYVAADTEGTTDASWTLPSGKLTVGDYQVTVAGTVGVKTETPPAGDKHTVTITDPTNGTLTVKVGNVEVTSGSQHDKDSTVTITATPNDGYALAEITVNGTKLEAKEGVYSFTLTKDVTIAATFEAIEYTLAVNETKIDIDGTETGGTISVAIGSDAAVTDLTNLKATVEDEIVVTVVAPADYIANVSGVAGATQEDADQDSAKKTTYTFQMPAENTTVKVAYEPLGAYSITIDEANSHGTVTVLKTADEGAVVDVAIAAEAGYKVTAVTAKQTDDNTPVTVTEVKDEDNNVTAYRFTMPAADVTITVTYAEVPFTITVADYEAGHKVEVAGGTSAVAGSTVSFTATPKAGYKVGNVKVTYGTDGVCEVTNTEGTYSFEMPASDVTITVNFVEKARLVSVTTGELPTDVYVTAKLDNGKVAFDGYITVATDATGTKNYTVPLIFTDSEGTEINVNAVLTLDCDADPQTLTCSNMTVTVDGVEKTIEATVTNVIITPVTVEVATPTPDMDSLESDATAEEKEALEDALETTTIKNIASTPEVAAIINTPEVKALVENEDVTDVKVEITLDIAALEYTPAASLKIEITPSYKVTYKENTVAKEGPTGTINQFDEPQLVEITLPSGFTVKTALHYTGDVVDQRIPVTMSGQKASFYATKFSPYELTAEQQTLTVTYHNDDNSVDTVAYKLDELTNSTKLNASTNGWAKTSGGSKAYESEQTLTVALFNELYGTTGTVDLYAASSGGGSPSIPGGGGGGGVSSNVTVDKATNGKVSITPTAPSKGATVTIEPFPKKRTQKVKKKWNDSRGIRYRWLCSGAEKIILKTRGRNPTQSRVRAEGVVEDFQIGKDIALRRRSGWIVF